MVIRRCMSFTSKGLEDGGTDSSSCTGSNKLHKKNRVCDESKVKTNDSLPPKRWQVKRFPFTFNQMWYLRFGFLASGGDGWNNHTFGLVFKGLEFLKQTVKKKNRKKQRNSQWKNKHVLPKMGWRVVIFVGASRKNDKAWDKVFHDGLQGKMWVRAP